MVKESASIIKQDNTTHTIRLNVGSRQGNFGGLSSLSYTSIKAYWTAVQGCLRDWCSRQGNFGGLSSLSYTSIKAYWTAVQGCLWDWWRIDWVKILYCTIGLFQIVRLISISALPCWWGVLVPIVERVLSVGVMDVSSLMVTRRPWFFVWVFLVVLIVCTVGLFHRRYKYLSWTLVFYTEWIHYCMSRCSRGA